MFKILDCSTIRDNLYLGESEFVLEKEEGASDLKPSGNETNKY